MSGLKNRWLISRLRQESIMMVMITGLTAYGKRSSCGLQLQVIKRAQDGQDIG